MPKLNKRRSEPRNAKFDQVSNTKISDSSDSSGDEHCMDTDDEHLIFNEKLLLTDIGDLTEMCKSQCGMKYLSTLIYMSLCFFNIKWKDADE